LPEAKRLAGLGVLAGASDLILLHDSKFFALEIKTEKGRLTTKQKAFLAAVEKAGGKSAAAFGLNNAIRLLETWGLLNGTMM
jgi:hypothetical protein